MIILKIEFEETTGALNVSGPITNKILSLGMLELARKQILDYDPAKAAPAVIPVKSFEEVRRENNETPHPPLRRV